MLLTVFLSLLSKQLWLLLTVLLPLPKQLLLPCFCITCVQMSRMRLLIVHCHAPITVSSVMESDRGCILTSLASTVTVV